jgi:hypothetical protein
MLLKGGFKAVIKIQLFKEEVQRFIGSLLPDSEKQSGVNQESGFCAHATSG